ncbi:leukocyte-specific transcript 1 protein [Tiliqua scincoides]|uniref:leukocyte-specific transcript 1 protein n=1 Tax=Tiliqua scincoides TaxID=71010 RepID=UPI003461CBB2
MVLEQCNDAGFKIQGFCIPRWLFWTVPSIGFVMLVTILILSICLCRARKGTKKRMSAEDDNPEEANLHYAELKNLPGASRDQCDGGSCQTPPAVQNSDYATVAELQGTVGAGCGSPEQTEDEGVGDEVENQPCVEVE